MRGKNIFCCCLRAMMCNRGLTCILNFFLYLCMSLHGQSGICIGSTTFTVMGPQQKSEHSYFLRFAEQSCCEGSSSSLGLSCQIASNFKVHTQPPNVLKCEASLGLPTLNYLHYSCSSKKYFKKLHHQLTLHLHYRSKVWGHL